MTDSTETLTSLYSYYGPAHWVLPLLCSQEGLLLILWGDMQKTCSAEILLVLRARKSVSAYLVHHLWCSLHTEYHSLKTVN